MHGWHKRGVYQTRTDLLQLIKGVSPRSKVDTLSELFFILKGRQLRFHFNDSEWSFSKSEYRSLK